MELLSLSQSSRTKPQAQFSTASIFILFLSLWQQKLPTPCCWQERLGPRCELRDSHPHYGDWIELTLFHAALGAFSYPQGPLSVLSRLLLSLVRSFPLIIGESSAVNVLTTPLLFSWACLLYALHHSSHQRFLSHHQTLHYVPSAPKTLSLISSINHS